MLVIYRAGATLNWENMEESKAIALCDELEKMVGYGPGRNEAGLKRVREIVREFELDDASTIYVWEKARDVLGVFEIIWDSVRKWKQYENDPEHFRAHLALSIFKLRAATRPPMSRAAT